MLYQFNNEWSPSTTVKDEHAFVFNLESNGRNEGPMKFDIKKKKCDEAFCLHADFRNELFSCGDCDIRIFKENRKSKSFCYQNEETVFNYRGVKKALVQNPGWRNGSANPKRFIVIQMI